MPASSGNSAGEAHRSCVGELYEAGVAPSVPPNRENVHSAPTWVRVRVRVRDRVRARARGRARVRGRGRARVRVRVRGRCFLQTEATPVHQARDTVQRLG